MLIKNDQVLLSIGMFSLAAAILLRQFVGPFIGEPDWLLFAEGILIGASIAFNVRYLVRLRRKREGG
jgi:hypothetical protein